MDTGNIQCCFSSKEAGTEFGHSVRRVRNHEEHVVGAVDNLNNFAHTDGSTFHEESSAMDKREGRITKGMQVQLDIEREKRCIAEMKVHHGQNEQQEIMDEEDGQEPLGDDELRENEALEQLREGDWHLPQSTLHSQGIHQQHQPQPPGPVIRWERFLPQRCLRVLLVENDDCTRQVVSALLRNCSYEDVFGTQGGTNGDNRSGCYVSYKFYLDQLVGRFVPFRSVCMPFKRAFVCSSVYSGSFHYIVLPQLHSILYVSQMLGNIHLLRKEKAVLSGLYSLNTTIKPSMHKTRQCCSRPLSHMADK